MGRLAAMCGADCRECEAYLATLAGDEIKKNQIAENWRQAYGNPKIDNTYVTCSGCLTGGSQLGGHCLECDIRACGLEHQVACCAYCPEYSCAKLETFVQQVPGLRFTLEELRSAL